MTLFNCSVGRWDCSRCGTAVRGYGCVWCGQAASPSCVHQDSCPQHTHTCPAPAIHYVRPDPGNPPHPDVHPSSSVKDCLYERWRDRERDREKQCETERETDMDRQVIYLCYREMKPVDLCSCPCLQVEPGSGPVEGGTRITISGSNLGQQVLDIQDSVTVAGVPCLVLPSRYEVSSRYHNHRLSVFSLHVPLPLDRKSVV